jgi:hypothetical protein
MKGSLVIALCFVFIWYGFFRQYNTQSKDTVVSSVVFICDDGKAASDSFQSKKSFLYVASDGASFPEGVADIALSDGRSMSLAQSRSADGAQYESADASFAFWTNGDRARIVENKKEIAQCIRLADQPKGTNLSQVYVDGAYGFSLRLPGIGFANQETYVINDAYYYRGIAGSKKILGASFSIPVSVATGTNLSPDTYISVEQMPSVKNCIPASFFDNKNVLNLSSSEQDAKYSVASLTYSKAGSQYEEIVYALANTNPCTAVRYFIHYSAIESYVPGTVQEFDKKSLLAEFDQIRYSLVVAQ